MIYVVYPCYICLGVSGASCRASELVAAKIMTLFSCAYSVLTQISYLDVIDSKALLFICQKKVLVTYIKTGISSLVRHIAACL